MYNNEIATKLSFPYIYMHFIFEIKKILNYIKKIRITDHDRDLNVRLLFKWAHIRGGVYLIIPCIVWALIRGGSFVEGGDKSRHKGICKIQKLIKIYSNIYMVKHPVIFNILGIGLSSLSWILLSRNWFELTNEPGYSNPHNIVVCYTYKLHKTNDQKREFPITWYDYPSISINVSLMHFAFSEKYLTKNAHEQK